MPHTLHHVDSAAYGYLTPETIDFTLECVRDANDVLFANEALTARDMIVVARSVVETEQLFVKDPLRLTRSDCSARSDWTLACIADGLAQAVPMLQAQELPPISTPTHQTVGRNDRCPRGSSKK